MADSATSTLPEPPDLKRLQRARRVRRIFLSALFLFVALGLAGRMGVRSADVEASADGYLMRVTYAAVTRPGLDTPFAIELRHAGGFSDEVTLAVQSDYLDMFDENGLDPDPSKSSSDDQFVYWTFDAPPGDVLRVSLDAITSPGEQWRRNGTVRLLDQGRSVVGVSFRTWVMP